MIDEVKIVGVGNSSNVPMWATDDVLKEILEILKEHKPILSKVRDTLVKTEQNTKQAVKNLDEIAKDAERGADAAEDTADAVEDMPSAPQVTRQLSGLALKLANSSQTSAANIGNKGLGMAAGMLQKGITGAGSALSGVAGKLGPLGLVLGPMVDTLVSGLSLIVKTLSWFAKQLLELTDVYAKFFDSAIRFGSYGQMVMQAGQLGISLEKASAILTKFSMVVKQTTVTGFTRLASQVSSFGISLGMTNEQIGEWTGKYLEMQRRTGTLQGKSTTMLNKGFKNLIQTMSDYSDAMGVAREEIMETVLSLTNSTMYRVSVQSMARGIGDSFNNVMQKLLGKLSTYGDSGKDIAKFIADLANPIDSLYSLANSDLLNVAPQLGQEITMALNRKARGEPISEEEMKKIMLDGIRRETPLLKVLASQGNQTALALLDMAKIAEQEKTPEGKRAAADFKIMEGFKRDWEKIKASVYGLFIEIVGSGGFRTFLSKMTDAIRTFGNWLTGFLADWNKTTFTQALQKNFKSLFTSMGSIFKDLWDGIKPIFIRVGATIIDLFEVLLGMLANFWNKLVDSSAFLDDDLKVNYQEGQYGDSFREKHGDVFSVNERKRIKEGRELEAKLDNAKSRYTALQDRQLSGEKLSQEEMSTMSELLHVMRLAQKALNSIDSKTEG